jgi:putative chitinase
VTINQKTFFDAIRLPLFGGRLQPQQVAGISAILKEWDNTSAGGDLRQLAYMLATTHHETGRKMLPIREMGSSAYFRRMYDVSGERPQLARANGNTRVGDGARFSGRGFVQLTWKNNYRRAGEKVGLDLVAQPDLALQLQPAIRILFAGMAEGWFTGKRLSDYFTTEKTDWFNARRIINGLDRARMIAGYARQYWSALQASAQQQILENSMPRIQLPAAPPARRQKVRPSKALKPQPRPALFHHMPMDPGR